MQTRIEHYIADAAPQAHVEPAVEEVNPAPTSCLAVTVWKPGPKVQIPIQKLNAKELTEEILRLANQVDEFKAMANVLSRRSVPVVAKCGRCLKQLNNLLGTKGFKRWKEQHKDEISETTIKRYKRVWEGSLVTDFSGMTLMEVYDVLGIKNGSEKKTKPAHKPDAEDKEPDDNDEQKQDDDRQTEQRLFNPSHQAFCLFIKKFESATPEERALTMIVVNEWLDNQQPEAEAI